MPLHGILQRNPSLAAVIAGPPVLFVFGGLGLELGALGWNP
jgi:hypothetical protein